MQDLASFSGLIGRIYDCALSPQGWPGTLEEVCARLHAKAASIHTLNPLNGTIGLYIGHGVDPAYQRSLMQQYAALSPTGAAIFMSELEQPVGVFDLIDEDEFRETRFYKEWCAPQGYYDMLGALIAKRPSEIGAVSATRLECQERFGAEEREFLSLLAPHVRRSVAIAGILEHKAQTAAELAAAMDGLSTAILIIDASAKIVRANTAAKSLLESAEGITQADGRLAVHDEEVRAAFKAAIAPDTVQAALGVARTFVIPGADGARIFAAVLPLEGAAGRFAVCLKPEEPDIPAVGRHLEAVFGMTPREVSIVLPLLQGRNLSDIAEGLGISMPTARTHLQRLFKKTGTQTQGNLVRIVLQSMPPMRLG